MTNSEAMDQFEAEAAAEALEKSNADTKKTRRSKKSASAPSKVYVFANLPTRQTFRLRDGRTVTLEGMPVSRLRTPNGGFFPGGKYGVTELDASLWDEVARTFSAMRIFKSGLIFAAPSLEAGEAMAKERGGLRHGLEPVDTDPRARETKSAPNTGD